MVIPVVTLAGVAAVAVPAVVMHADKYEGSSETQVYGGCLGDYKLPSSTLTDIATYADQLSVIDVLSDRLIAPPPESQSPEDPYSIRVTRVKVEETLWRRDGAPEVTGEFELTGPELPEGGRKFITADTELEVGSRYLAPLTLFDTENQFVNGGESWAPLTRCVVFPLDGEVIAEPVFLTYPQPQPIADRLVGMSVEEFAAHLQATPPNPVAVP